MKLIVTVASLSHDFLLSVGQILIIRTTFHRVGCRAWKELYIQLVVVNLQFGKLNLKIQIHIP